MEQVLLSLGNVETDTTNRVSETSGSKLHCGSGCLGVEVFWEFARVDMNGTTECRRLRDRGWILAGIEELLGVEQYCHNF